MQDIRLEDIVTILGGTIVTAIVVALTAWAWERRVYLANRYLSYESLVRFDIPIMESMWVVTDDESNNQIAENEPVSAVKRNGETEGNGVAIGETEGSDPFQFPDLFTGLARLVLDKKMGETEAIRIAVKAAPGKSDRYQEARRRLHAAMEREQPSGPQFVQGDGTRAAPTYPVSGRRAAS